MVRLLCQHCPVSCGDQGEKVDQIRAERAVTALVRPEDKMTFGTSFSDTENSNDTDSIATLEMTTEDADTDSEGDHLYIAVEGDSNSNENNNNNNPNNNNVQLVEKRKERRRERNRRSAQAYRQRRRQQNKSTDTTLHDMMERNHQLREKLNALEQEKTFIMDILKSKIKIPWPYPVWMPYPTGMWSSQDATMSTPIAMDSAVQEVTVAS